MSANPCIPTVCGYYCVFRPQNTSRCFGIAANVEFILVCTYEEGGANLELIIYKKR